jgi:hypothetical protein
MPHKKKVFNIYFDYLHQREALNWKHNLNKRRERKILLYLLSNHLETNY